MKPNKEAAKNEDEKKDRNHSSYSELPDDEESTPTKTNRKESKTSKDIKESWVFRKNKSTKVKNDPMRFSGDGISFKAKIIGIEKVFDARGNRMCQDALQKLKAAVKTSGEHKQRILLNISLLGIRIKDEKTGEVLHHHPVHKISFISQDTSDNRAFGYVFGCPQTGHQFFGIKTEKTAFQVVRTLQDLFHTALELKKKEIERAMEQQKDLVEEIEENHKSLNGVKETNGSPVNSEEIPLNKEKTEDEHVYSELSTVNGTDQISKSHSTPTSENTQSFNCTVDNLLDLQFEMDTLQQGITQMEYSIASAASIGFGVSFSEDDNSISSGCSYPVTPRKLNRMPSLYHETLSVSSRSSSTSDYTAYAQENSNNPENFAAFKSETSTTTPTPPSTTPQAAEVTPPPIVEDRYAVFYQIDSLQSVFDNPTFVHSVSTEENMALENPCPQENGDSFHKEDDITITKEEDESSATPAVFAELDPLGDHPFVEKEKFFEELKNPPKKVLKDLIGCSCDSNDSFAEHSSASSHLNGESNAFPADKGSNPFVSSYPPPPKLPPKRSFGIISPPSVANINKPETLPSLYEENISSFKNPYNPFVNENDEFAEIPLPTSPPPPPPPRLLYKDPEAVPSMSPPPRPPSRSSVVPTPPRPRRKVPLGSANCSWFSFDQDAINASHFQTNWDSQPPSSPPLPVPSRKLPPSNKFDLANQKSCSASNSPASMRRYSNVSSSSTAFREFSESVQLSNGTASPSKKLLTRHSSIIHESWGQNVKSAIPDVKNPFEESSANAVSHAGSDCAEVKRILNRSPPLPPKSTGIAGISRPRPSPSRKMLSASSVVPRTSSSSSSTESKNETVSSSSLRYSSIEGSSSVPSGSEALYRNSTSSQSDSTFSSGYNGEVSGETMSTESSLEKISPTSPDSIFRRKSDPFADDFFLSLPKKLSTSSNSSVKNNGDDSDTYVNNDLDGAKISAHFEGEVFETKAT